MLRNTIARLFPTPSYLRFGTIGVDLSDSTLRLIRFQQKKIGLVPALYDSIAIPDGALKGGRIMNQELFVSFLKGVQKKHNVKFARVSIPEQQTYSFSLKLDKSSKNNLRTAIEMVIEDNIPLKVTETVFDFEVLEERNKDVFVQVYAMAENTAQLFFESFSQAGIIPVCFELEGQAQARAVLPVDHGNSSMILDIGAIRTGVTIVAKGVVVFSSTIDFGGNFLTRSIAEKFQIDFDEAEKIKKQFGLSKKDEQKELFEILTKNLALLREEVNRHFIYWHEKRQFAEILPNVNKIYLSGGHSNMIGFSDYLAASLKVPVVMSNPWIHCFSFEDSIPEIKKDEALSYVTAIGLAISDYKND